MEWLKRIELAYCKGLFFLSVCAFGVSCTQDVSIETSSLLLNKPNHFPEVNHPEGNEFTQTRWALGKALFFDKALSIDSSVSCASCHSPAHAFSGTNKTETGVFGRGGTRNAPTLANVGYHASFTREGGIATLEQQVLVPIQEHNEFGFNIIPLTERLDSNPVYHQMSMEAYGRPVDAYTLVRAIACYERTLVSGWSAFDDYSFNGDANALGRIEKAGLALFNSDRLACSSCHSGLFFTNDSFANNGLYANYTDDGRKRLTGKEEDDGVFKIPSLRNVALTGPYMHDGSLETLEDVIEHYDKGGNNHANKSNLIKPLNLTVGEKQSLIAFLKTLTDWRFIEHHKSTVN